MQAAIRFWNRNAQRYARQPITDEPAYQYKLEVTRQHLRPDMHVLEFGCGTGSTALLHAPYVASYLATDVSQTMIDIARAKLAQTPIGNLRFDTGSLDTLPDDARFDAVLGLNILHLLPQPGDAIQTVYERLTPGGVFVSTTACLQDTRRYLRPILFIARLLGLAPPVTFLSRRQLDTLIEAAGFHIRHRWTPATSPDAYFVVAAKPSDRAHTT